jgi:hypothetical protein
VPDRATPTSNDPAFVHPVWTVIALLVMGVALGLTVLAAQPPAAMPETAPDKAFSAGRAMALLQRVLGDEVPHPVGSAANARVAARIGDELTALGYPVQTRTSFACRAAWAICGDVTNIASRLPGQVEGPAVLLTAHYDSVAAGPGAADDMAGVAAILEIARILRDETPRHPVIFLFSDGEEPGLLGAEAFVAEHPWAAQVGVVVNLEANGTHGQSILFETTENNSWLIDGFVEHAPRPVVSSISDEIYGFLPFNTDLTVYEEAGLPGINFAFTEEYPHYHTPLDQPANLSPGSLQHHGDNALAAVRAYTALDLADPPPGSSVFQEVAPGLVARWPKPWTVWIALLCAAAWMGVAVTAVRRGEVGARAVLWGLPVMPLGVLAATLLGFALGMGVSAVAGAPVPWYANPLPMRVALWAGTLLCLGLVAAAVTRGAGFRGVFLGVWLCWAVLSVIVAALAPAASVLLLLPTGLAALAALVVTMAPFRTAIGAWEIAAIVALFGASWFWLFFARGSDYSALGPDLGPTMGFAVGMAASALAPFAAFAPIYTRWRRWSLAGPALLMIAAVVVAAWVPVYSESRPERLNILHVADRQAGEAFWVIDAEGPAPEALRRAGSFAAEPAAALPWSSRLYPVSPATPTARDAARQLRAGPGGDGTRVAEVQLAMPPGSDRATIYVPVAAGLSRIDLVETGHTLETIPTENGCQRFYCFGASCDGLTLGLHLAESAEPTTFLIVYSRPRLPDEGDALVAARPLTAVPSGGGDASLVIESVTIE